MTAKHRAAWRKRNPEYQAKYRAANKEKLAAYKKSPKGKYDAHRTRAKQRGIEWGFTFDTWWAMWEPHFDNMGQTPDSYHMCRTNDVGPYSPENCRIDTARNNGREGIITKHREVEK